MKKSGFLVIVSAELKEPNATLSYKHHTATGRESCVSPLRLGNGFTCVTEKIWSLIRREGVLDFIVSFRECHFHTRG